MWTIEINCRRFLGNYTIVYTNSFWNQYFSVNQSDLRDRKERIHKLFIRLRWWPTCLLQNTAQPEKRDIFMKWERGLLALRTPIPSLLQSAASAMGQFISLRNDMTFSDIWNNTTSNISKLSKIPRAGTLVCDIWKPGPRKYSAFQSLSFLL